MGTHLHKPYGPAPLLKARSLNFLKWCMEPAAEVGAASIIVFKIWGVARVADRGFLY